jgi:hypothetical protein
MTGYRIRGSPIGGEVVAPTFPPVTQRTESLITNQMVAGSNPAGRSN